MIWTMAFMIGLYKYLKESVYEVCNIFILKWLSQSETISLILSLSWDYFEQFPRDDGFFLKAFTTISM